eukprot:scaffold9646_cov36-Cyclotella_meneghiniana.AAC.1
MRIKFILQYVLQQQLQCHQNKEATTTASSPTAHNANTVIKCLASSNKTLSMIPLKYDPINMSNFPFGLRRRHATWYNVNMNMLRQPIVVTHIIYHRTLHHTFSFGAHARRRPTTNLPVHPAPSATNLNTTTPKAQGEHDVTINAPPGWFLVQFVLQFTRVPHGVEHPGKFSGLGVTWRSFGTALDRGEHS